MRLSGRSGCTDLLVPLWLARLSCEDANSDCHYHRFDGHRIGGVCGLGVGGKEGPAERDWTQVHEGASRSVAAWALGPIARWLLAEPKALLSIVVLTQRCEMSILFRVR